MCFSDYRACVKRKSVDVSKWPLFGFVVKGKGKYIVQAKKRKPNTIKNIQDTLLQGGGACLPQCFDGLCHRGFDCGKSVLGEEGHFKKTPKRNQVKEWYTLPALASNT